MNKQMRIYAYKTVFDIKCSQCLDDFWGYLIFRLQVESNQYTYNRLARLHNILSEHLDEINEDKSVKITLRESDLFYRFKITTDVKSFLVSIISRLEHFRFEYKYNDGVLRYKIHKQDPKLHSKAQKKLAKIYDFVTQDDLDEMSNILERLESANYEKVYSTLSLEELSDYRSAFSYYATHLQFYIELKRMYSIVAELSVILSIYTEKCLELGNDLRALLKSFTAALLVWQRKLFESGVEDMHFMDASFEADLSQIKLALHLYDEVQNDISLDDIFDF